MFDLRRVKNSDECSTPLYWETNVDRASAERIDRKAIEMNKFVVTCLEFSQKYSTLVRLIPKEVASEPVVTEVMENGPTIWGVKHSPSIEKFLYF